MIERDLEKKLCETLLKPTLTDNRIHKAFVPIKNSDRRAFARGAPAHHVHASLERIGMPIQEAQIKDLLDVLEIEAFTDPGRQHDHCHRKKDFLLRLFPCHVRQGLGCWHAVWLSL